MKNLFSRRRTESRRVVQPNQPEPPPPSSSTQPPHSIQQPYSSTANGFQHSAPTPVASSSKGYSYATLPAGNPAPPPSQPQPFSAQTFSHHTGKAASRAFDRFSSLGRHAKPTPTPFAPPPEATFNNYDTHPSQPDPPPTRQPIPPPEMWIPPGKATSHASKYREPDRDRSRPSDAITRDRTRDRSERRDREDRNRRREERENEGARDAEPRRERAPDPSAEKRYDPEKEARREARRREKDFLLRQREAAATAEATAERARPQPVEQPSRERVRDREDDAARYRDRGKDRREPAYPRERERDDRQAERHNEATTAAPNRRETEEERRLRKDRERAERHRDRERRRVAEAPPDPGYRSVSRGAGLETLAHDRPPPVAPADRGPSRPVDTFAERGPSKEMITRVAQAAPTPSSSNMYNSCKQSSSSAYPPPPPQPSQPYNADVRNPPANYMPSSAPPHMQHYPTSPPLNNPRQAPAAIPPSSHVNGYHNSTSHRPPPPQDQVASSSQPRAPSRHKRTPTHPTDNAFSGQQSDSDPERRKQRNERDRSYTDSRVPTLSEQRTRRRPAVEDSPPLMVPNAFMMRSRTATDDLDKWATGRPPELIPPQQNDSNGGGSSPSAPMLTRTPAPEQAVLATTQPISPYYQAPAFKVMEERKRAEETPQQSSRLPSSATVPSSGRYREERRKEEAYSQPAAALDGRESKSRNRDVPTSSRTPAPVVQSAPTRDYPPQSTRISPPKQSTRALGERDEGPPRGASRHPREYTKKSSRRDEPDSNHHHSASAQHRGQETSSSRQNAGAAPTGPHGSLLQPLPDSSPRVLNGSPSKHSGSTMTPIQTTPQFLTRDSPSASHVPITTAYNSSPRRDNSDSEQDQRMTGKTDRGPPIARVSSREPTAGQPQAGYTQVSASVPLDLPTTGSNAQGRSQASRKLEKQSYGSRNVPDPQSSRAPAAPQHDNFTSSTQKPPNGILLQSTSDAYDSTRKMLHPQGHVVSGRSPKVSFSDSAGAQPPTPVSMLGHIPPTPQSTAEPLIKSSSQQSQMGIVNEFQSRPHDHVIHSTFAELPVQSTPYSVVHALEQKHSQASLSRGADLSAQPQALSQFASSNAVAHDGGGYFDRRAKPSPPKGTPTLVFLSSEKLTDSPPKPSQRQSSQVPNPSSGPPALEPWPSMDGPSQQAPTPQPVQTDAQAYYAARVAAMAKAFGAGSNFTGSQPAPGGSSKPSEERPPPSRSEGPLVADTATSLTRNTPAIPASSLHSSTFSRSDNPLSSNADRGLPSNPPNNVYPQSSYPHYQVPPPSNLQAHTFSQPQSYSQHPPLHAHSQQQTQSREPSYSAAHVDHRQGSLAAQQSASGAYIRSLPPSTPQPAQSATPTPAVYTSAREYPLGSAQNPFPPIEKPTSLARNISQASSHESLLRTPSSLAPSLAPAAMLKPTTSHASADSQAEKKRGGFFGLFKSKRASNMAPPPAQSQYEIWQPSAESSKQSVGDTAVDAAPENPSGSKTSLASRSKVPPPVKVPIPIQQQQQPSRPAPNVFTPFRYMTTRRRRTPSSASMDAQDGTAGANTTLGSPTVSMASQNPAVHIPPLRDAQQAAKEWRDLEEATAYDRAQQGMRRQRPGVVVDAPGDPSTDKNSRFYRARHMGGGRQQREPEPVEARV